MHFMTIESLDLAGRTAVVTGAARGIGLAACRRLLAEGCNVLGFDLPGSDFAALDELKVEFPEKLEWFGGSVASPEDWTNALAETLKAFGKADILFNNAGIPGPTRGPLGLPIDDFDQVMSVNVRGVFLGMQTIGRQMKQDGGGVIINVSSISGERGGGDVFAYTTSKHAVNGMTKSAAVTLARHKIRVLAISPCPIGTDMIFSLEQKLAPDNPAAVRETIAAGIPMKRYGKPEEIADLVAFLASDRASFMTGACIPIDGGTLAN